MNVPGYIVEQLKCGQCGTPLSRAPVYQQRDGTAVCTQCLCLEHPATRNRQYEATAKLLGIEFPCRYQERGCQRTIDFVSEGQVVKNGHEEGCKYQYYFACPLLSASRCEWWGAKRWILQHCQAQHPGQEWLVTCVGCGAETALFYLDGRGWRCERCASARRACENQDEGCTYRDFPAKCEKHERYFCEWNTTCYFCCRDIPRGTLAAHYASAHSDKMCSAGAPWQAIATDEYYDIYYKDWFLVTCPAGIAVCKFFLDESVFSLKVRIPVPSERLREFRCEVRVTDTDSGYTYTDIDGSYYDKKRDWEIYESGLSNGSDFEVCVNITNI